MRAKCGALLLLCLSACDPTHDEGDAPKVCAGIAVYGLFLTIETPGIAADAEHAPKVVATDGAYSETLEVLAKADGDTYQASGASERPGTYTVAITAAGFQGQTLANFVVRTNPDFCNHATSVEETIVLEKNP